MVVCDTVSGMVWGWCLNRVNQNASRALLLPDPSPLDARVEQHCVSRASSGDRVEGSGVAVNCWLARPRHRFYNITRDSSSIFFN